MITLFVAHFRLSSCLSLENNGMSTYQVFHMLMQLKALCMLCSALVQTFYMLLVWSVGL